MTTYIFPTKLLPKQILWCFESARLGLNGLLLPKTIQVDFDTKYAYQMPIAASWQGVVVESSFKFNSIKELEDSRDNKNFPIIHFGSMHGDYDDRKLVDYNNLLNDLKDDSIIIKFYLNSRRRNSMTECKIILSSNNVKVKKLFDDFSNLTKIPLTKREKQIYEALRLKNKTYKKIELIGINPTAVEIRKLLKNGLVATSSDDLFVTKKGEICFLSGLI